MPGEEEKIVPVLLAAINAQDKIIVELIQELKDEIATNESAHALLQLSGKGKKRTKRKRRKQKKLRKTRGGKNKRTKKI